MELTYHTLKNDTMYITRILSFNPVLSAITVCIIVVTLLFNIEATLLCTIEITLLLILRGYFQKKGSQHEREMAKVELDKAKTEARKAKVELDKAKMDGEKAKVELEKAKMDSDKVDLEVEKARVELEQAEED